MKSAVLTLNPRHQNLAPRLLYLHLLMLHPNPLKESLYPENWHHLLLILPHQSFQQEEEEPQEGKVQEFWFLVDVVEALITLQLAETMKVMKRMEVELPEDLNLLQSRLTRVALQSRQGPELLLLLNLMKSRPNVML